MTSPSPSSSAPSSPPPKTEFQFGEPFDDGLRFDERVRALMAAGKLPERTARVLLQWYETYVGAALAAAADGALAEYGCEPPPAADGNAASGDGERFEHRVRRWCSDHFSTLYAILLHQRHHPFDFAPYHRAMRGPPFDFTSFGNLFSRPMVNLPRSYMEPSHSYAVFERIVQQLAAGDNVCLLGNHQSEADPFAIYHSFRHFFGERGGQLAEAMIFMAGDRVRDDPLAAPFSAGRSMLTVFSKNHINDDPARKAAKHAHNRRSLKEMERMFAEGGKAVWFAPSGGRDRRSPASGRVECAPFDADAVEMFRLSADRAARMRAGDASEDDDSNGHLPLPPSAARRRRRLCHYYPMAMGTYNMLPPPESVEKDMGELRVASYAPVWVTLLPEIDWEEAERRHVAPRASSKQEKRQARADYLFQVIDAAYKAIGAYEQQ